LEGQFGHSDLTVGDLVMKNQYYGKVRETEVFDDNFCCIVGLAYPSMKAGSTWHVPFFDSLMLNHGITSFMFDLDTPALRFNPEVRGLDVAWNPVVKKLFWSISLDRVTLEYKDKRVVICDQSDECLVTPDSGSSALTAPTWAYEKISAGLFDASECDSVYDSDLKLT
jgi:Eukaryotic aspartyl protease